VTAEAAALDPTPPTGRRGRLVLAENLLLAAALATMMTLPLLEIVLRKFLHTGISAQTALVQHLTLVVGMVGGAIAARDGRLLALGTVDLLARGRLRTPSRVLAGAVAAAVTVLLGVASVQFVASERAGGRDLAYGVPLWIVQVILPVGFALIAWRLVRRSADAWKGRMVTAAGVAALVALAVFPPVAPAWLEPFFFALLLLAVLVGAPIFTALGGAGLILFWQGGSPIASLTVDHYSLVTNPTLPTVPLFTLAGYFLANGGAAHRLIRVFRALVGHLRGGPAILVALVCAFFTAFTGASGVTILALGGLLMPVLLAAGYRERTALGLLTGTGSLGLLLPPCLPLIFYGVIAGVDIADMFLGGILPGFLLILLTVVWGISQAPRVGGEVAPFAWREAGAALWGAKWELLTPVVALGGLLSGLSTPVEAAALTAFYCFVVETFVYRDLDLVKDAPRVVAESGVLIGGVLLILGVALGFTNYLAFAEVPARAVDWVTATVEAKWAFLLLLNIFLLIVGMLMDVYSAIVIVVPLIVPLGNAFGIAPVHLGIIFLANLELGYLTPPVGMNLFLSSLRFNRSVGEVARATVPMMLVLLIGVLLITYVPIVTTLLPGWLGR
jgi:tripartite ATP-independent transporter DctM subunit